MRVLIAGGGRTGSELARTLLQEKHEVTVVEQREEAVARLRKELPAARVVLGDACEPNLLEANGIKKCDVVAAVTGHDEDNLVVCLLARNEFRVRRTVARVNNPKNEWLFTRDMGVDVPVSQAHIMGSLMREEMATLDMAILLRLHRGDTVLVEHILGPQSGAAGVAIRDLSLPETIILVAVVRNEDVIIPRGAVVLQAGDHVLALAHPADRDSLAKALG